MFWMKWICREVRGAAAPWPTTSAMFWEREEDTAADRPGPKDRDRTVRNQDPTHPGLVSPPRDLVYLLLLQWAELRGQASRSSAELEPHWLSGGWALE